MNATPAKDTRGRFCGSRRRRLVAIVVAGYIAIGSGTD